MFCRVIPRSAKSRSFQPLRHVVDQNLLAAEMLNTRFWRWLRRWLRCGNAAGNQCDERNRSGECFHKSVLTELDRKCPTPLVRVSRNMRKRVILEPELEQEVSLMTASQRLELARKFERWAHQLRISAFILKRASQPKPRPSLKALSKAKLILN
jgi:hypothetical protein